LRGKATPSTVTTMGAVVPQRPLDRHGPVGEADDEDRWQGAHRRVEKRIVGMEGQLDAGFFANGQHGLHKVDVVVPHLD